MFSSKLEIIFPPEGAEMYSRYFCFLYLWPPTDERQQRDGIFSTVLFSLSSPYSHVDPMSRASFFFSLQGFPRIYDYRLSRPRPHSSIIFGISDAVTIFSWPWIVLPTRTWSNRSTDKLPLDLVVSPNREEFESKKLFPASRIFFFHVFCNQLFSHFCPMTQSHTASKPARFLGASKHLYKRVCPSVRRSVRPSVRPLRLFFYPLIEVFRCTWCRVSGLVSLYAIWLKPFVEIFLHVVPIFLHRVLLSCVQVKRKQHRQI